MSEHNTREGIEEIVQEAHKITIDYMDRVALKQAVLKNVPYNSPIYILGGLKEYLRTSIHQELQKARAEILHKLRLCAIGKYEGDALENVKAQIKEFQDEL